MDILLINPDHSNKKNNFPWGALSIGSYLSNIENYEVKILDASGYSNFDFYQKLKYYCNDTKLAGISFMSTDIYSVKNIIDFIKRANKKCKIIVGGPHAVLQPEQTCLYKNIDFVAFTEGEYTLATLIKEIKTGNHRYEKVPGLIYKEDDFVKRTCTPQFAGFYDINYDLLEEKVRRTFTDQLQVLSGRGCSFKCTFCFTSVCGSKWRGRPATEVMRELEGLVEKYDPNIIYFRDENFFHSKSRIEEFITLYKERKFSFKWEALCRASYYHKKYIDLNFLEDLESINCVKLKFGLESGSQRVLKYLKKGIKVDKVKKMVDDLSKVESIRGNYSFMIGVPGETYEEYKQTFALVKYIIECEPDAEIVGPQFFRIYPGGELYEEVKSKYGYYEPQSFEDWAKTTIKWQPQAFRQSLNINYPWIPVKHKFLTQNADLLVALYSINIKQYFKIKRIFKLFLILCVKLRMKYEIYNCLYDLKLGVFIRQLRFRLFGR